MFSQTPDFKLGEFLQAIVDLVHLLYSYEKFVIELSAWFVYTFQQQLDFICFSVMVFE